MPSVSPVARSAVQHLYELLLGRAPTEADVKSWGRCLDKGTSVGAIYTQIEQHAKAARGPDPMPDHPLKEFSDVFTKENLSYFTYRGRYRPLGLLIETVNICNNDCVICPYSSQTRSRQMMPLPLFEKVIDDYVRIGGGPVSLTPMVGELFLDKRLRERLVYMRKSPSITRISAITNATMARRYTEEELAELLSFFDRFSISVYGFDAEEYRTMTRKTDYEETNRAISRILRLAGPEKVSLGARQLKKRSQEEIDAWLGEIAQPAGIRPEAIDMLSTITYANWSFFDTSEKLPFDAEWSPVVENTTQCGLPLASIQVLSDGTVSFCGCANFDGDRGLVLGNAKENSLGELLDTDLVRRLWNWAEHGVPEFCRTCSFHLPLGHVAKRPKVMEDPFAAMGG
ncbi:MAG: radical SAM/SPASM domain-containing protein [Rhodomicrobiaceae bacterium]